LVLLDEIGTGTDPAQGAALAQAVLEELVNQGCRVVVTTHYQRIKELAAEDPRFRVAAMEFIDNRPTYRLRLGFVGESYALEAGRRMQLPERVLARADSLLDKESRKIIALQRRLEEETQKSYHLQQQLEREIAALSSREAEIERRKQELEAEIDKLRQGKVDEFLSDVKRKEREVEELFERAKEAAMIQIRTRAAARLAATATAEEPTTNVEPATTEKTMEATKAQLKNIRIETEKEMIQATASDIATPLPSSGDPIPQGASLIVLEKGQLFGMKGYVMQRNKGRGKVHLRVAGMEIKIDRHQLGIPREVSILEQDESKLSQKEIRYKKMIEEELVDPENLRLDVRRKAGAASSAGSDGKKAKKVVGMRTTANTIDLRRLVLQVEAQRLFDAYIEEQIEAEVSNSVVYIQHSANSESASSSWKSSFRSWLRSHPLVNRSYPADSSDGGELFTVAELALTDN
jgi:DNA mismatch repair protein MutS2